MAVMNTASRFRSQCDQFKLGALNNRHLAKNSDLMTFIDVSALLVGFLTMLKIGEMAYHKKLVVAGTKEDWQKLPITRVMRRFRVLHWLLFKLPTQIFLLSLLGFSAKTQITSGLIAATIIFVLWFLVGRMMYDLLYAGTNRHLNSVGIPDKAIVARTPLNIRGRIRSFVSMLIGFVVLIVFGYASVFHICHKMFKDSAFTGIPGDGYDFFYFIYYSLVTFGTVGYGDISPAGPPLCTSAFERITTRALVASEICLSFIVVAVFIASFSLAFSHDASSSSEKEGYS